MKLEQLFYMVCDSWDIQVIQYGIVIAEYDGKNSIDEIYNSAEIVKIAVSRNLIKAFTK